LQRFIEHSKTILSTQALRVNLVLCGWTMSIFTSLALTNILMFWALAEAIFYKPAKYANKRMLFPLIYFLFSFLFLFNSTEQFSLKYDVEKALPLAVLSLVFYRLWELINFKKLLSYFAYALLIFTLIALLKAGIFSLINGNLSAFFYTDLSLLNHPGYLGIGYCILFIISDYTNLTDKLKLWCKYTAMLMVYLLSAKIVWLILLIIVITWLVKAMQNKHYRAILGAIAVVVVSIGFTKLSTVQDWRVAEMSESIQSNEQTTGSTGIRMAIWGAFAKEITSFNMLGEGKLGGEKKLMTMYEKYDLQHASEQNLNAHNQWIQSYITNGLLALVILLVGLLSIMLKFPRLDVFLLLLTIVLFLSIESALFRQVGQNIVLFASAICLYIGEQNVLKKQN